MPPSARVLRTVSRHRDTHRAVVALAEDYLNANRHAPPPVSSLCRAVGLSERALRNAFYDVHGVGPKRWMRDARLHDAHRALERASAGTATVTGIATAHGFYELGRFSATYKEAYGESPSVTLRAAGARTLDPDGVVERTR